MKNSSSTSKSANVWTDGTRGFAMETDACFPTDYTDARARFLATCEGLGVTTTPYPNPNRGPLNEALFTDTAWFGSADAERVIVLVSSTHGAEGFCGCGAQMDWLTTGGPEHLPEGVAVLIVHVINPHGFAWLRRTTEEGVDLNRNWIDFEEPLPENPGFAELADVLLPREIEGPVFEAAEASIKAWRQTRDEDTFQIARGAGQYTHPGHFNFGGVEPTWARRILETIAAENRLAERDIVAVIDYHTGQGPFGYGEPICGNLPGTLGNARAKAWYGESITEPTLGTSTSVPKTGLSEYGWTRMVGESLVYVALEFGTYDPENGRRVLRQDYWLHLYGKPDWQGQETRRIKADIRKRYYPDTDDWRQMVLFRSRQIIKQALAGLTGDLSQRTSLPIRDMSLAQRGTRAGASEGTELAKKNGPG